MKKFLKGVACGTMIFSYSNAALDPFSKIIITSTQATCVKNKQAPKDLVLIYNDNVQVTFADQTSITADELEIIIDNIAIKPLQKESSNNKKKSSLNHFKSITFKNNVRVVTENRTITSRNARIFLPEKRCVFAGEVSIVQSKKTDRDIPVSICSNQAELNLLSGTLRLLGNSHKPVSTTIILEGHPVLSNKKKAGNELKNSTLTST